MAAKLFRRVYFCTFCLILNATLLLFLMNFSFSYYFHQFNHRHFNRYITRINQFERHAFLLRIYFKLIPERSRFREYVFIVLVSYTDIGNCEIYSSFARWQNAPACWKMILFSLNVSQVQYIPTCSTRSPRWMCWRVTNKYF